MALGEVRRLAVRTVQRVVGEKRWRRLRSKRRRPQARRLTPEQQERRARRERLRGMNLTELAQEFGTDKWGTHRYTPHYERHFAHLRTEQFTLLEIGIGGYGRARQGGASLRMWKHFFRRAQIVGLDIKDKSFVDAPRIRTYQGSQTDESVLRRIFADAGEIRVVIDDGSHRPEHIRETFRLVFPLLADGGIYVIEDTQTSYWPEFGGSDDVTDPSTTMALVKELIDGLHFEEYVDETYQPTYTDLHVKGVHVYHNLVFIEKGDNREGTNRRRVLRARYRQEEAAAS